MGNPGLGYPYFVGLIYAVFGPKQYMVSFFNTLLSIILSLLMYHSATKLFGPRVGKIALMLSLFFPPFVSASYYILKDTAITFVVVLISWAALCLKSKGPRFWGILLLLLPLVFLFYLRPVYAILLVVLLPFYLVALRGSLAGRGRFVVASFLALAVFLAILYLSSAGQAELGSLQRFSVFATAPHTEAPQFLYGASLRHPEDIVARIGAYPVAFLSYSLESVFQVFWGPTLLYARSGPQFQPWVGENLGAIFMTLLMPLVIYGVVYSLRHKRNETLLFYSFIALLTIVLIFGGDQSRYRLPMMPFVLMFGAVGFLYLERFKAFYAAYIVLFAVFAGFNVSLLQGHSVGLPVAALALLVFMAALVRGGNWSGQVSRASLTLSRKDLLPIKGK